MDRKKGIRGQSLVEFALSISLLMLILLGVFDLGRVFHTYIVITNAAREGAYYGSMHPLDGSGIQERVVSEAQNSGITLTADNVNISTSGLSGTPMCVTVHHDFALLTTWLVGRQTLHLESCAEMVVF